MRSHFISNEIFYLICTQAFCGDAPYWGSAEGEFRQEKMSLEQLRNPQSSWTAQCNHSPLPVFCVLHDIAEGTDLISQGEQLCVHRQTPIHTHRHTYSHVLTIYTDTHNRHTRMYTLAHIEKHTVSKITLRHVHTQRYPYLPRSHTQTYTHIQMYSDTNLTHIHTQTHMYTNTYTTDTYTQSHVHANSRIHTHPHIQASSFWKKKATSSEVKLCLWIGSQHQRELSNPEQWGKWAVSEVKSWRK